jgi:hypothetical protein
MPTTDPADTALLAFLKGTGRDSAGRTLAEVLRLDDTEIERRHNFIQWLFPLPNPSAAVPDAPVISREEIATVRGDPALQAAVKKSLQRMTEFYGRSARWLTAHDHNHLRITRIIRSVGLLLGPDEARTFFSFIMQRVNETGNPVSPVSLRFWRDGLDASR